MATGTNPLQDLFRQQTNTSANTDESGLTSFYEVMLKIVYWTIDHIPYINTWFRDSLLSSMDSAITPISKRGNIQQLSVPTHTGFTARQVDHIRERIVTITNGQIARWQEAPDHALCYTLLGVVSKDVRCIGTLTTAVNVCFQRQQSIHLGTPVKEKRPTLSPDFVNVCITILPPLPIIELFIHGPIDSKDRKKLKNTVIAIATLTTVHFEVGKTSAEYFTRKASSILDGRQTIVAFNLTLMGKNKQRLKFNADPWPTLNAHPRCTLTYTNVTAPDAFVSNKLTFQ